MVQCSRGERPVKSDTTNTEKRRTKNNKIIADSITRAPPTCPPSIHPIQHCCITSIASNAGDGDRNVCYHMNGSVGLR